MKSLMKILAVGLLAALGAYGDIVITLDQPAQTGIDGQTLQFFGTISNTGRGTVFLNGDSLNISDPNSGFTLLDQFGNVPLDLLGGTNSGDIELFDVQLSNPFTDPAGTYPATYTLLGGADANAQDVLAVADFTVSYTATPEPSSMILLGTLLGIVAVVGARRVRGSSSSGRAF